MSCGVSEANHNGSRKSKSGERGALRHSARKDDGLWQWRQISSLPVSFAFIRLGFGCRRGFGCLALSLAQRSLLVLLSLSFLGARACRPRSFGPVSTVIRLECHWILLIMGGLISYLTTIYMPIFEFARPAVSPPNQAGGGLDLPDGASMTAMPPSMCGVSVEEQ
jgi:hypothetical protein